MRRGEIWSYRVPAMAPRTVVLIASQAMLDSTTYRLFPALELSDTDPGHLLAVTTEIDGQTCWIDTAGGWMRARRSLLAAPVATLPAEALEALDARIAATLDPT